MSFARLRLIFAALLFLGWLGWLGYAVSQKGSVQIVSRAQAAGAPHWVVGEVTIGADGLPNPAVNVKEVLKGEAVNGTIEVRNLRGSMTPLKQAHGTRSPVAGTYLLFLERTGERQYRIAGLPRSPGYQAQDMDSAADRAVPVIYPWNEEVKKQISSFR